MEADPELLDALRSLKEEVVDLRHRVSDLTTALDELKGQLVELSERLGHS